MFGKNRKKELQKNRLQELRTAVEEKITDFENRLEDALGTTDPGQRLLTLMTLKKEITSAQLATKKQTNKPKIAALKSNGIGLLGVVALAASSAITGAMVDSMILLCAGAATIPTSLVLASEIILKGPFTKKGNKQAKALQDALTPAIERMNDVQIALETAIKFTRDHDPEAVVNSPAFKTLKAEFPDIRNDFAGVIQQKILAKLQVHTHNDNTEPKKPKEMDKPKSKGIQLPKKRGDV